METTETFRARRKSWPLWLQTWIVLASLHGTYSHLLVRLLHPVCRPCTCSCSTIDSPIEIVIGSIFLYRLLGVSCFFGLAVTCLFLPMNHYAGKVVVNAQDNLMKARDERVALMNEVCVVSFFWLRFWWHPISGPRWYSNAQSRLLCLVVTTLYSNKYLYTSLWHGSVALKLEYSRFEPKNSSTRNWISLLRCA